MLQPRCGNYCSKIETKVRRSSGHQSDPNLSPRLLPSRSNVDLIIFDFFLEQKSSFWHTMWQSRAMCALPCARGGKANWLAERGLYKGHSHSSIWHLVSQSFLPGAHHDRQVGKCFICVGMEKKKKPYNSAHMRMVSVEAIEFLFSRFYSQTSRCKSTHSCWGKQTAVAEFMWHFQYRLR